LSNIAAEVWPFSLTTALCWISKLEKAPSAWMPSKCAVEGPRNVMDIVILDDGVVAAHVNAIDTALNVVGDEGALPCNALAACPLVVDIAILDNGAAHAGFD
jgi:hypothetical protein